MRHVLALVTLLVVAPGAVAAQGDRTEQEVRAFLAAYD